MSAPDADEMTAALGSAVEGVIQEREGGFSTRWLVIVESVGADGQRGLWTCVSDDMRTWDALGLLEYAKLLETRGMLRDDDEDD